VTSDASRRGGQAADRSIEEPGRVPRSGFLLAIITLLAIAGIAGFTSLGIWQIERRAWKLDLISRVDARIHAPAVPAPGPAAWPAIDAKSNEYQRVTASGHFLNDRETFVAAVTAQGAGYWLLTPLKTRDGFIVLINRGFVPADRKEQSSRAAGTIDGETTVTGLLRLTEPKGGFLRANDISADRWFSRDVDAIAIKRGLDDYAPYFIDAEATPNAGGYPVGGLTVISFPNNHLVYALTWFALAIMVAAAFVRFAREEIRVRRAFRGSRP
jgi:surfeit locus 1 family protein